MLEPLEPVEPPEPPDKEVIRQLRELAATLRSHPEMLASIGLSESDMEGDTDADRLEQLNAEIEAIERTLRRKADELEALRAHLRARFN